MKHVNTYSQRVLMVISIVCLVALCGGIIWSSNRSLELTDESYYLLSAIHPEHVQAYISAQHWILAPLWGLTESLRGFRLTGGLILAVSAIFLAVGSLKVLGKYLKEPPQKNLTLCTIASACVYALLYVSTIAPSPSYNLLAAASAYAGAGAALFAVSRENTYSLIGYCVLAGVFMMIGFINKPSAGICCTLVISFWILFLTTGQKKWIGVLSLSATIFCITMFIVFLSPINDELFDSIGNGFELFRQVQKESISSRLIRYAVSLLDSIRQSLEAFAPAIILFLLTLYFKRIWLVVVTLIAFILIIVDDQNYLGGIWSYHRQLEVIYVFMIALIISNSKELIVQWRLTAFFLGLISLPFAVAMGTGNALFTQIIVSLAPWGVLSVCLLALPESRLPVLAMKYSLVGLSVILITAQIFTSYTREPYHLAAPLTAQTVNVDIKTLGNLYVDTPTAQMLIDIDAAKQTCNIKLGAMYVGLYNLPGLALTLDSIPPITPWINNLTQANFVLKHWDPESSERIILAISNESGNVIEQLPASLNPKITHFEFCGKTVFPYNKHIVEIWASP